MSVDRFLRASTVRLGRVGLAFVVAVVVLLCGSASALADVVWRIVPASDTTVAPGGQLTYHVELTNVGDTNSDVSIPTTLRVTLPAGMTGVSADTTEFTNNGQQFECPGVTGATVITCTGTPFFSAPQKNTLSITVAVGLGTQGVLTTLFDLEGGGAPQAAHTVDPVVVSSAAAVFGVDAFDTGALKEGAPLRQAGGHPDEAITAIDFNTHTDPNPVVGDAYPVEDAKDITVELPPGLVGNPTGLSECTMGQLVHGGLAPAPLCPATSQVGVALVRTGLGSTGLQPESVFNMVPPPNAPARFAFDVEGTVVVFDAHLRTGGDYGIDVTFADIPESLAITGTTVTFWGVPADPSHDAERWCPNGGVPFNGSSVCPSGAPRTAFFRYPTSCTAPGEGLLWRLRMDSWQHPGALDGSGEPLLGDAAWKSASVVTHELPGYPFTPGEWGPPVGVSGCDAVPFTPSVSVHPTSSAAASPSGLSVGIGVPQKALSEPDAVSQADVRNVAVRLPEGVVVNPSAAGGLGACTPAQIDLHSSTPAACPDASKIGSAEVNTPLLTDVLHGGLFLASQNDNPFGSLLAAYLVVEGHGVVIKVAGRLDADPVTGRLTAVFKDLPQQPVSDVKIDIAGGPHATLSTPSACGTGATESVLDGWNGKAAGFTNPYSVDCSPGLGGFGPSFMAGMVNNQAGGFSPFTVTFSRQDGEQGLGGVTVKTPPGLLGILKGVERCPEPQAAQGACGEGSLIGHVTAAAGTGPDPFYTAGGKAFLTGPYKGSPFGLSVTIPAKAGPFDLGTVVVRSRIDVDSHTSRITISSDPFPTILQGIPLQIRTVNVTVDRAGFMFNPTNCSPLSVDGAVASTQGATAGVSSRFQAANCASLPFKPSFRVATKGATSKKAGAFLDVKVTSGTGQANLGKVAVSLPKQLPSRLTTIQQACTAAVFEQNPASCPVGSNIGIAKASTPILASPVAGPVYLVSHGGAAFPDLVMVLQGEGVTLQVVGSINIKNGITSSAFNSIPDAPISTFELTLPQGPHSALGSNVPAKSKGSLCGQKLVMPTTLGGQNGAQVKQSTNITVAGCSKAKKAKKHTATKKSKHGKRK